MKPAHGKAFVEKAIADGIPRFAVQLKCRNWGIPSNRSTDIAEEAAAEAYRRSLSRLFNDSNHYRAWVTRTAINLAIDQLRRQSRTASSGWDLGFDFDPTQADQLKETLAEALDSLNDRQRLLLSLSYEEGLTLNQIARQILPEQRRSPNAGRLKIKRERDEALKRVEVFLAKNGFSRGPAKRQATESLQTTT